MPPGTAQSQAGQGLEQPSLVGCVPAHGMGMFGLDDPEGPFQSLAFCDSIIL